VKEVYAERRDFKILAQWLLPIPQVYWKMHTRFISRNMQTEGLTGMVAFLFIIVKTWIDKKAQNVLFQ
jgi:hypothetical protein